MNVSDRVQFVSYGDDPLARLTEQLLEQRAAELPFLGRLAVLFPTPSSIPRFRRLLLKAAARRGWPALLPPWTGTLRQWVQRTATFAPPPLSHSAREILLYEAISGHPTLGTYTDPWALVDNLLDLFDELTVSRHHVAREFDELSGQLAHAYGLARPALTQLGTEARLVHDLWLAWREQLAALTLRDPTEAYTEALSQSSRAPPGDTQLYLVGFVHFSDRELD